jgi:hypothetical protein
VHLHAEIFAGGAKAYVRAAFPAWALPMQGNKVHVEGSYIWDCAHGPYRTEIHPAPLTQDAA